MSRKRKRPIVPLVQHSSSRSSEHSAVAPVVNISSTAALSAGRPSTFTPSQTGHQFPPSSNAPLVVSPPMGFALPQTAAPNFVFPSSVIPSSEPFLPNAATTLQERQSHDSSPSVANLDLSEVACYMLHELMFSRFYVKIVPLSQLSTRIKI